MARVETEKIRKLREQRAAIDALLRQEQYKLSKEERARDNHRKILVGAAALEAASRDTEFATRLDTELKHFLTNGRTSRPSDFELFGFPVPASLLERKNKAEKS